MVRPEQARIDMQRHVFTNSEGAERFCGERNEYVDLS